MFSLFKLFKNKENTFSYENQTKTNFENKENEFTIFNILYMNQKIVLCCFFVFELNRKHGIWSIGIKRKHGIVALFFFSFPFVFHFDFLLIRLTKTRDCE